MREVSANVGNKLEEQFRPLGDMQIEIPLIVDENFNRWNMSTGYGTNPAYISGNSPTSFGKKQYATFETDFMKVGSNQLIAPDLENTLSKNIVNLYGVRGSRDVEGNGETVIVPNEGRVTTNKRQTRVGYFTIPETATYYYCAFMESNYDESALFLYRNGRIVDVYSVTAQTPVVSFSAQKNDTFRLLFENLNGGSVCYEDFLPMVSKTTPNRFEPYSSTMQDMFEDVEMLGDEIGEPFTVLFSAPDEGLTVFSGLSVICSEEVEHLEIGFTTGGLQHIYYENYEGTVKEYLGEFIIEGDGFVGTIYVTVTPKENRRARIQNFFPSAVLRFTNKDIISCDTAEMLDTKMFSLPQMTMNFSVTNYEHQYDVDNLNGVYRFIKPQQKVKLSWGYGDDLTDICYLYLDSSPVVSGSSCTFTASDALAVMTNVLYKNVDFGLCGTRNNPTPADKFRRIIDNTKLAKDISVYPNSERGTGFNWIGLPADSISASELMQAWCNALAVPLKPVSLGKVEYLPKSSTILSPSWYEGKEVATITLRDWGGDAPQCEQQNRISAVSFTVTDYTKTPNTVLINVPEGSEDFNAVYALDEENRPVLNSEPQWSVLGENRDKITDVRVFNDRIEYSVGRGERIGTTRIDVATFKAVVNCDSLTKVVDISNDGETIDWTNPLMLYGNDFETRILPLIRAGEYFDARPLVYTGRYVQNPAIQVGDIVKFETPFSRVNYGIVEQHNLNFLSCWGSIAIRRLNV